MLLKPHLGAAVTNPDHPRLAMCSGFWLFNEGGGSVIRDIRRRGKVQATINDGSNHDALTTNGPLWTQERNGPALNFNGTNQYALTQNGANAPNFIRSTFGTVVCSVYLTSNGSTTGTNPFGFGAIFADTGGFYGLHYGNVASVNQLIAYTFNGGVSKSAIYSNPPLNTWIDLAWRETGSNIEIYANGVLIQATAATGTDVATGALYFGRNFNGANFLPGRIGYIATFDRILTVNEIQRWHVDPFGDGIFTYLPLRKQGLRGALLTAPTDMKWIPSYPDKASHPGQYPAEQLTRFEPILVPSSKPLDWLPLYPEKERPWYVAPRDFLPASPVLMPGGVVFDTQYPVEDLEQIDSTILLSRLTQYPVEDHEQAASPLINARLSQMVIEFLIPFSCATNPPVAGCPADVPPPPVAGGPGCDIEFAPDPV